MKKTDTTGVYNALIVEDEPIYVDQLSDYISQVGYLNVPQVCCTGIQALKTLSTSSIDILFLDLSLPDIHGLELLKTLTNPPAAVVITSCHTERAVDCYNFDVIDFLPKPYNFNRFLRSLSRVLTRTQPLSVAPAKSVQNLGKKEEIYIKSGRHLERFYYSDILYVEAYGQYSKIHTLDGIIAVNKRISALVEMLPESRFIRIHKSYIVNVDHLKRLDSKLLWVKATKLPIGVTYQPLVQDQLAKLGITAPPDSAMYGVINSLK